jgi:asparagine synthase (glutamine-hydrolysing)
MCGISGITHLDGGHLSTDQLEGMIAPLAHRGPDANGLCLSGSTGLAHARLSIIDLQGGQQPMSINNGTLWITFNGEIFNYVELRNELNRKGHAFTTRSDTEVILHMYAEEGEDCVHHFNGQWAFAIWDEPKRKLFLSRDRVGVRPLFYTQTENVFLFASEIKALLAYPGVKPELDLQALDQIFTFWVMHPPRTAFKNIKEVPPGHSLLVENGEIRVHRYWTPKYSPETSPSPGRERRLAEDLLNLLLDATRIRLRSDVPVGAYLSGGLDSTVITALTHILVGDRLRTFSVSFEDSEFDESAYQREASAFLHTQHTDVSCTYGDIADVFPDVIWHTEQPILRVAPAPLFLLSRLVRESGFKVVLTGEGADEMLGGYDIFKEAKIRRFWAQNPSSRWRPLLLKRLYPYMDGIQRQPTAYLKSFFHIGEKDVTSPFFSHLPRWELTSKLKMFFSNDVRAELGDANSLSELERKLPDSFALWAPFNQAEYLEAMYLLPGYILSSQGDRMAMAHSVEGRYPFLDHRVIDFAAKLPTSLKMKVLSQKYLLRRVVGGLIPESIRNRYKQPYRAPDGKSLFAANPDYLGDMLSEEQIRQDGIFDPQAVSALVAKFKSGWSTSVKDNMALIGILSTQLLLQQFIHNRQRQSSCNQRSQEKHGMSS